MSKHPRIVPLEGGTSRGVGYWSTVLSECPRKAVLMQANQVVRRQTPGKLDPLLVGAIAHTMMAEWFTKKGKVQLRDYRILDPHLGDLSHSAEYGEAARCYRAYTLNFPKPNRFGKVVAIEKTIEVLADTLTIKPDLVCAEDVQVDHKFVAAITPEVVNHYLDGLGAVVYLFGGRSKKIIYNFISKEAEPQFATVERAERPDDRQRYGAFVEAIHHVRHGAVNPTACHQYKFGRPHACEFYGRGCNGY